MLLDIPVSHVMTKKVVSVTPGQELIHVKHIYEKKNFHHHIPVVENEHLVGIISLQDFLQAVSNSSLEDQDTIYWSKNAKDIMREHPVTISQDASLRHACQILSQGNIHALIVCEDKRVKGILSTTDVLNYFLMLDESEAQKYGEDTDNR